MNFIFFQAGYMLHQLSEINKTNNGGEYPYLGPLFFCFILICLGLFFLYHYMKAQKDGSGELIDPKTLILASIIIKADEKLLDIEIKKIQKYIENNVSKKNIPKYMGYFQTVLTKKFDLKEVITETNYDIRTFYFLISIAVSDKLLTNSELRILNQIRESWKIPQSTFNSILAMFNFTSEEDLNKKTYVKTYSENSITKYYTILEITESANEEEIKLAYRKLVKIYHPDKQIGKKNANLDFAKQKFHLIQEAYEKVKNHRGFS